MLINRGILQTGILLSDKPNIVSRKMSRQECVTGGWLDRGASDSCEDPKVVFVLADPPAKVANTAGSLHDIRAYMHFWADFWI